MKNVLKPFAKSLVMPLGLTAAKRKKEKEFFSVRHDYNDNVKWRNEWYYEND